MPLKRKRKIRVGQPSSQGWIL